VLAIAMLLARPLLFEGEQPTQAVAKDSATPTAQPEGVKQPATAEEEESARTLLVEDSQRAAANAPALDPRRVRILARILDQDRRPLPGAWLAEDEEQFFSTRAIPRRGAAQRAAPERSLSDPAGEVVYERGATSSRESLRLAAGAPGHVSAHLQALVRGGEIVFLGDIQLGPASSVSGRVIDEAGSPLAGIEVTALRAGTVQRARSADVAAVVLEPGMMAGEIAPHTVSGADGAFELNEVSPGVIRIWGRLEGNRWAHAGPLQLEAGVPLEHVEVLAVRPPAAESAKYEIHGLVLQPDGSPFEGVSVRAAGRSGGSMEARSGKDGRFVLSTSTRGPFFLSAHFMNAKRRYRDVQRRGVVPGPEEIELRFEEPRWMSIEVLADGAPCPEFVVFTTSAGRRSGAQLDRAPGEASNKGRLLLPDGEFGLRVEAPGFAAAEVGPFEQGSAPESVHIELHAPASVTGHVFSNRSPVAGAKMELIPALVDDEGYVDSFLTTYDTLHSVSSRTDESGAFHASVVDPGQYHVCVTAEGFARSDSGALSIDPTRGLEGLVIELDQGGSLEGTVLVAKDLTPAGIIVSLNRGDGMPRTQRVGPDGRFRFERLTPGPWVLARSDREAREEAESSTFSGGHGSSVSLPFNCTIRGGSTTKQDLDLRADRPCSLSGRLSIQGSPAWAWSVARTTHSGKKIYQGWMGSADLDSAGKFMLEVESPGEWTLELHSPPEAQASMTLLVTLPLVAGKNEWTFDVPAGRLEGRVLSPHDPSTRIRTHPSGLGEANVALELASDGTFVVPVLPAGPGEIVEDQPGSPEPRVLARFTVAAGSTTRIDVP
jgi:hypothetical protein